MELLINKAPSFSLAVFSVNVTFTIDKCSYLGINIAPPFSAMLFVKIVSCIVTVKYHYLYSYLYCFELIDHQYHKMK